MIKPLYNPEKGIMRVVGFMSGSGSNIRKLLEYQKIIGKYNIVALFSDNAKSNAANIGKEFDIPVIIHDIRGFYHAKGKRYLDLSLRPEFDELTVHALQSYEPDIVAYGGYMSVASSVLINSFLGVNVHPADLSIENNGKRKYTGSHAVTDAIRAGEKQLRASTHLITQQVDGGPLLLISKPIAVVITQSIEEHQQRLKENGDWIIFPKTLDYIAQGRFARDENNLMYFDDKAIPQGLQFDEKL